MFFDYLLWASSKRVLYTLFEGGFEHRGGLLATQLLLLTDFDPFCDNLILILCKTVDSFTEVTKAKPITVNHSIFNEVQLLLHR